MWIKRVRIKRCSRRLFKSIKSIAFMRELIVCASSATTTIIAFWKQRKKRRLKNIWFHSFSVPSTHHVYPTWMYNVCDAILNNKMNQCWISWIYYHRIASILFATWKCIFYALSAVCDAFSNIKTWLYHRRTLHTEIKFSSCTRCSTREFKEEKISINPKNFHLYGYTTGRTLKDFRSGGSVLRHTAGIKSDVNRHNIKMRVERRDEM